MPTPLSPSLPDRLHRAVAHARTADGRHFRQLNHSQVVSPFDAGPTFVHQRDIRVSWGGIGLGVGILVGGYVCAFVSDVFLFSLLLEAGLLGLFLLDLFGEAQGDCFGHLGHLLHSVVEAA